MFGHSGGLKGVGITFSCWLHRYALVLQSPSQTMAHVEAHSLEGMLSLVTVSKELIVQIATVSKKGGRCWGNPYDGASAFQLVPLWCFQDHLQGDQYHAAFKFLSLPLEGCTAQPRYIQLA